MKGDIGLMSTRDVDLSAVVVCYNEARFLGPCLQRLSFCDEIIVVDLGSTDGSIEIAERAGAKVITHEWVPFAEKVRGYSIAHAKHDWVLIADPDMLYPEGVGTRIKALIAEYEKEGLGLVTVPFITCYGERPLRHGQKGGTREFRAVLHRERVEVGQYLHGRGLRLLDGFFAMGILSTREEVILHYWVNDFAGLMEKGRRYLGFEGESRLAIGQSFSWRRMARDLLRSLYQDIKSKAFLDINAAKVMLFQQWYLFRAHMDLRKREKAYNRE